MQSDGRALEQEAAFDGLEVCQRCCPVLFEPMDLSTHVANAAMTLNEEEVRNWIAFGDPNPFGNEATLGNHKD